MLSFFTETVGLTAPSSVDIMLSTVSLDSNFDAYLSITYVGADPNQSTSLLVDSGNTMLIVPRWEDIAAIPNWQSRYRVLGVAQEPWGCPANVVQGPIQLMTETGDPFLIEDCVFYACTADSSSGERSANFGSGCITPWTASGWNTPAGIPITLQSPLAYLLGYAFAEFDFAAANEVLSPSNSQGVSEQSLLRLYKTEPSGYRFLNVIPNCSWMALRPKSLSIEGVQTNWPEPGTPAIAMVDTGGTSVYLSDPTDVVYSTMWPDPARNPDWTSGSLNCTSTKSDLQITVGDDTGAFFSYEINEAALPASAQGLTLVMCERNNFMQGEYGMNLGGISALAVKIVVDFAGSRVGLRL